MKYPRIVRWWPTLGIRASNVIRRVVYDLFVYVYGVPDDVERP